MIAVIQPGMMTTIQDEGRMDFLAFGLPRAGVMDRYAARMANLLCGNPINAAVLEMTMFGGAYKFENDGRIALCGADMQPKLNERPITAWAAVDVKAGDVLELGYATIGCRTYLAVRGGFDVPVIMGSRATYIRAEIGGLQGRKLKTGDKLPVGEAASPAIGPVALNKDLIPDYPETFQLRVLFGPQEDLFAPEGRDGLLQSEYCISNEADRMGYRIEGPPIKHLAKADIVSDALCRGAIQVPGNGQPIIMMSDCGTTGGYAKIATVIGSDIWKLAQGKPQDRIRFVICTDQEALEALAAENGRYEKAAAIVAAGPVPATTTNAKRMILKVNNSSYTIEIEEVE